MQRPEHDHRSAPVRAQKLWKMELGLAEDCEEHAEEARHVPWEVENKLGLHRQHR